MHRLAVTTRSFVSAVVLLATTRASQAQSTSSRHTTPPAFASLNRVIAAELSGDRAFRTVAFVEQFFRLPGNRGFDASIDTVAALLSVAGYVEQSHAKSTDRLVYRVESRAMPAQAWTPDDASLTIVGRNAPLLAWATNHNMLAINSYATPDGGVTARLIDVGAGADADLAKQDIKGAIVLVDGNVRATYPRALQLGALGVLAAQKLPAYNQQTKNATAIQFTSVPNDSMHRGFTIFVSSAARDSLKAALAIGPVTVRAMVKARFETRPERTLVAELRGSTKPAERFVYSAHVQEPGANDNASGVGLLAEIARASAVMFKSGQIKVMCNHSVLTTGFDAPKTDMILIARQVFSRVRYMQMVGRGLRGPKNGGTEHCKIVTVHDNMERFDNSRH